MVNKMNRLQLLCYLNNQQGGTIHEFNTKYACDILLLSESDFNLLIAKIIVLRKAN
jgi:hypothetical protein